jgi:hypothetical protein
MSPQNAKLKMTPHTGKNNDAPTRKVFTKRQTDTTIRPDHTNAVWRMARLESRRRARQAAIPPRVGACSLRTGDT